MKLTDEQIAAFEGVCIEQAKFYFDRRNADGRTHREMVDALFAAHPDHSGDGGDHVPGCGDGEDCAACDRLNAAPVPQDGDERARAAVVEALEETQGLLAAMLHETRDRSEIEAQMIDNRKALDAVASDVLDEEPEVEMCAHCRMPVDAPGYCVCNGARYEREHRAALASNKAEPVTEDCGEYLEFLGDNARDQLIEKMARAMNVATDGHDRYWSGYIRSATAAHKVASDYLASNKDAAIAAVEPVIPDELNPDTAKLVRRFARALANKLLSAQRKYGYGNSWLADDWQEKCREELHRHVAKGDPRDVAAYCAFMWHHDWSTAATHPAAAQPSRAEVLEQAAAICENMACRPEFEPEIQDRMLRAAAKSIRDLKDKP